MTIQTANEKKSTALRTELQNVKITQLSPTASRLQDTKLRELGRVMVTARQDPTNRAKTPDRPKYTSNPASNVGCTNIAKYTKIFSCNESSLDDTKLTTSFSKIGSSFSLTTSKDSCPWKSTTRTWLDVRVSEARLGPGSGTEWDKLGVFFVVVISSIWAYSPSQWMICEPRYSRTSYLPVLQASNSLTFAQRFPSESTSIVARTFRGPNSYSRC